MPTVFSAVQEIGTVVADFHLTAITGSAINLETVLHGKRGSVVAFWSAVCSHCMRYDKYFNDFSKKYPELGLVAIASRDQETLIQLRATAAARELTFPILHDPAGVVARQWFTRQTPRVFLIDSDRVLRYRGAIDNYKYSADPEFVAYLETAITQFLSDQPLERTETASFGCAIQSVYYKFPKAL